MTLNIKITAAVAALWASAGFAQTQLSDVAIAQIQDYAQQSLELDKTPVFQGYNHQTQTARFEQDMELPLYIPKAALFPNADPGPTGLTRALKDQRSDPEGFTEKYNAAIQSLSGLGYLPSSITYRPDAPNLQPEYLRDALNLPTSTQISLSGWMIEDIDGQPLAVPMEIDGDSILLHVKNPILPGFDTDVRNLTTLTFNDGLSPPHAFSVSSDIGSVCQFDCLFQTVAISVEGALRGSGVLIHNRFVLTANHVLTITNGVGFDPKQTLIMNGPNNRDQTSLTRKGRAIQPIASFDLAVIELEDPFQSAASIASLLSTQRVTAPIISLKEADFDDVAFVSSGFGGGQVTTAAGRLIKELAHGVRRYNHFVMAEECPDCAAHEFLLEAAPDLQGKRNFSCGIDSGSPALVRTDDSRLAVAGILTESLNPPLGDLRCATAIKFQNLTHPDVADALHTVLSEKFGLGATEIAVIFTDTPPVQSFVKQTASLISR
ncbi:trypsin [Primorskyibacter sedentarius]|uniref:Trypsin n=1 Tax=Primorskyibacter sedentarius TaxID=745311 RepID=A0A4V2UMV1_9RHOB|nr:trypsin-like serine protease [Primorskyibacter sedentarius]TCS59097.1 trypsin [Primorskyibacter sedentarius]